MTTNARLQSVLEDEKLLSLIMTKTDNRFVILLNLGYVLFHCNARKLLIFWHEYCSLGVLILHLSLELLYTVFVNFK